MNTDIIFIVLMLWNYIPILVNIMIVLKDKPMKTWIFYTAPLSAIIWTWVTRNPPKAI